MIKTGILLANLGTPEAPTAKALRRYLAEFLWDPRVVEIPRPIWWIILNSFILPLRPRRSAKLYQKIWAPQGSPLLINSQKLAENLQHKLGDEIKVMLAMRYGQPSIKSALDKMRELGIQRFIVIPLYPQYSAATNGSIFDAVTEELKKWRHVPELYFLSNYYYMPTYIDAVADSIKNYWQAHGKDHYLLFSFHGIPKRNVALGDPYQKECEITVKKVAEKLNLSPNQYQLVFQSRFGPAEWLQPYCDETLKNLPGQGIKKVAVICPGFAVDCLETLEEIAEQNQELFLHAGGESYHYIPALNDSAKHVDVFCDLIKKFSILDSDC